MTLLYSDTEEELRGAVRDLLTDKAGFAAVLARTESAEPYDPDLWKSLARDIGAAGLLVPESHGGAGATAREAAVVLEELGRAVAPVPFLTSAVLATHAAVGAGAFDLLGRLAEGEVTAALVVSLASTPYRPVREVSFDGGEVSGRITGVAGTEGADVLLVPVGGRLLQVEAGAAVLTPVTSFDQTRPIATVEFAGAPAVDVGPVDLAATLGFGAGLLASEQFGAAQWCLDSTVAYLKERKQFARPVGSFQALKHRLADLWLEVVGARAAARGAADLLASGQDARIAVAVAAAHCGEVAVHAAEECVQLHGGIGMTWEHPAHLYLKRAKAAQIALGTPGDHREALAVLADLPGPVAV